MVLVDSSVWIDFFAREKDYQLAKGKLLKFPFFIAKWTDLELYPV